MLPFFSYVWLIICRNDEQYAIHVKYSQLANGRRKTDAGQQDQRPKNGIV